MEYTTNNINQFCGQFCFEDTFKLEDYYYKFNEVAPQITFHEDESLFETLKKNYQIIGNQSNAFGHDSGPSYLFEFIERPETYHQKYFGYLETSIRHQGSIYTETFYWLIFMIEILNRQEDAICSKNSKIPLEYQIYYENYIIQPLIESYINKRSICFWSHNKNSKLIEELKELESESYSKEKDLVTESITFNFVKLVEAHLCRIKDKLLDKCLKEEITPVRALWLSVVPITFEEISNILNKIKNQYIRVSLFWVSGFQKITLIKDMAMSDIEKNAFDLGFENSQNNIDFEEYSNDKKELYTFHPCFFFKYNLENWHVGISSHIDFYDYHYSKTASEYKNYYK